MKADTTHHHPRPRKLVHFRFLEAVHYWAPGVIALHAYPDARINSLTQQTNFLTFFFGRTTLVAAIEYTPG